MHKFEPKALKIAPKMPVFDVFKPNLAPKHKQNASVSSLEPLQQKIIKRAVSRLSKFSGAL